MFIINSGVDVSLVAEELNSSSEEQEYNNTHKEHEIEIAIPLRNINYNVAADWAGQCTGMELLQYREGTLHFINNQTLKYRLATQISIVTQIKNIIVLALISLPLERF